MSRNPRETMRTFWDEKARENATYYISSYRPYDAQDDAEFWRWGEILTARLLEESGIPFHGSERVLEIGCGIGRMTLPLARRFREVTGIDVSEEMVLRAEENLRQTPNARSRAGNGTDLSEFPDASFDFVFSYLVLQHVPAPEIVAGYLKEIGRVLAPGGWCHVQVNGESAMATAANVGALDRVRGWAARALAAAGLRPTRGPRGLESPAWRGCRVPLAEARVFLDRAGLEWVRSSGEDTQYLWLTARRPDSHP
jgi:ubiquinone/menaquinone biosynthesis C-methylase UbiE